MVPWFQSGIYGKEFVHYEFEIPEGTTAELKLTDGTEKTLAAGKYMFTSKAPEYDK